MSRASLERVIPVLPVRDVERACAFYSRLGFTVRFQHPAEEPRYAGLERDRVLLHLQWHEPITFRDSVDTLMLRFLVEDVDALYSELKSTGVVFRAPVRTEWGTYEFAFYDPDGNGLTFFRNL